MASVFMRSTCFSLLACTAGVFLSGCAMTSPSHISAAPIEVRHDRYNEMLPVAAIDHDLTQMIGQHYGRFGQGPMDVTVTYLSGDSGVKAGATATRIAKMMREVGIENVQTATLPVNDATQVNQVMMQYDQVTAAPPKNCGTHPGDSRDGLANSEDGRFQDYRFGCGVDTYLAQQVLRPKDLLGVAGIAPASGERASARLKDYRDGKDFKKLSGNNASESIK